MSADKLRQDRLQSLDHTGWYMALVWCAISNCFNVEVTCVPSMLVRNLNFPRDPNGKRRILKQQFVLDAVVGPLNATLDVIRLAGRVKSCSSHVQEARAAMRHLAHQYQLTFAAM